MYHQKIIDDIKEYICHELKDSIYYMELSLKAPTSLAKEILLRLSNDEKCHAESFMQAYYYLTGRMFTPLIDDFPIIPDFEAALRNRMLAETNDYKKYGERYLEAPNKYLSNLFFLIKTVEAQHAMKIPILFEERNE